MYLSTLLSISLTPHSSLHLSVQPCSFSVFFYIFMYLSVSVFLRVLSFSDLVSALVSFCLSLISCLFLSLTLSVYLYNSVSIIHPLCIYISTHVCFVFISSSSHPYSHSRFLYPNILLWICQILSIFLSFSLSLALTFFYSLTPISLSPPLPPCLHSTCFSHPGILGIALTPAQGQEMHPSHVSKVHALLKQ